jgi:general nucleoside transport system permease protein
MQNVHNLLQPGLQLAAPLILAAIGGLFSYRAGIFNIALEGFMLTGAYFAVKGAAVFGSIWLGLMLGVFSSLVLAAVMGAFVLFMKADEVIVGIAVNLLAFGMTTYLLNSGGSVGAGFLNLDSGLPSFSVPGLSHIPVIKEVFDNRDPLVWASWFSIPVAAFVLRRTLFGMRLRAAGESPLSARAAGVPVTAMKFWSFLLSGLFCGLAGAQLSLGSVHLFSENMTSGRGIIAFAAVIFGGGAPLVVGLAGLMFGFAQALAGVLQINTSFPPQFVLMSPYVLAVVVLALGDRRNSLRLRLDRRSPPAEPAPTGRLTASPLPVQDR